jgi:hypothetical protein
MTCAPATSDALDRSGWDVSAARYAIYTAWELDEMPSLAIDGDTASRYSTGGAAFSKSAAQNAGVQQACEDDTLPDTGCWNNPAGPADYLLIDLGAEEDFDQLVMDATGSDTDYPSSFRISVSTDNVTFTQVAQGIGVTVTSMCFDPQTARYIKVEPTATSASSAWWSVHELNVY